MFPFPPSKPFHIRLLAYFQIDCFLFSLIVITILRINKYDIFCLYIYIHMFVYRNDNFIFYSQFVCSSLGNTISSDISIVYMPIVLGAVLKPCMLSTIHLTIPFYTLPFFHPTWHLTHLHLSLLMSPFFFFFTHRYPFLNISILLEFQKF